eukprot:118837-Chlamydomonas_euryale.AAC.9
MSSSMRRSSCCTSCTAALRAGPTRTTSSVTMPRSPRLPSKRSPGASSTSTWPARGGGQWRGSGRAHRKRIWGRGVWGVGCGDERNVARNVAALGSRPALEKSNRWRRALKAVGERQRIMSVLGGLTRGGGGANMRNVLLNTSQQTTEVRGPGETLRSSRQLSGEDEAGRQTAEWGGQSGTGRRAVRAGNCCCSVRWENEIVDWGWGAKRAFVEDEDGVADNGTAPS